MLPTGLRFGSVVSILIYAVFAVFLLSKAGLWDLVANETVLDVGLWVMSAYLVLGVLMNAVSRSKPERNLMTPTALVLAVCVLVVTLA